MSEKLQRALALHESGQLTQAQAIYEEILDIQPDHSTALNLLGAIAIQTGNPRRAVELCGRAIAIDPTNVVACCNSALALTELRQFEAALERYDQVLSIDGELAEAHFQRGQVLCELKQFDTALASYQRAIDIEADYAEAYLKRGDVLSVLQQCDAALDSYDQAISVLPDYEEAYFNRGNVLGKLGRFDAALASYDRAIYSKPDYAEAYSNRGIVLKELGQWDAALESLDRAIALKPEYAAAHSNRGVTLLELKGFEAALQNFDRAIALVPDYAEAYSNRGIAQTELKRFDAALQSYDQAIALKADYAEAYSNRGVVLTILRRLDAALASLNQAIALRDDYAEAYSNRGDTLSHLNRLAEALASYRRALELKPDLPWLYGKWLHARMHVCDWEELEAQITSLAAKIERGEKQTQPFAVLALIDSPALQRRAAEAWVRHACPASGALGPIVRRMRGDRIRVGYFSADFHGHATANLAAQLFEQHDRTRFHVTAFSFGPNERDAMRKRLSAAFDKFIDVRANSSIEIAERSRELQIDIAVDLKGFTQDHRAGIFAHRAAPIQVSYLGYPGTMGASYIDYIIADRIVIPEQSQQYYVEKVVYLPTSYQPNDRNRPIADKEFSRAELGLPPDGFVFCCFNNTYKITPEVFDCWMRILRQVKDSVLWLLQDDEAAARKLRKRARARDVDDVRLIFAPRTSLAEHLARQRAADLFLDTMPYNAHTTASDALWVGLPVLTRSGQSFAARVAASLLNAVGLPELVATSTEQYEQMAIALATDTDRLAQARNKLRRNRLTEPLFDSELLTRHLEQAYVQMYERYQQNLAPEPINVMP